MTIPSPLQSYLSLIEVGTCMMKDQQLREQTRRSHYGLSPKSPISDEAIYDILTQAIKHVPTAFNSQTGRVVLVLGQKHTELWDAVFVGLKDTFDGDGKFTEDESRLISAEREERNKKRFETSFKSGYGTIVFFEDQDRLKELSIKSPDFAEVRQYAQKGGCRLKCSFSLYGPTIQRGCCNIRYGQLYLPKD